MTTKPISGKMSILLGLAIAGLFSLGASGVSAGQKTVDDVFSCRDCNIVFVSFDALQAAHVHSYGYAKPITPTIDAMASRGIRFSNDISVSSWTVPASMTWFTGVYPSEHKLVNKFSVYDPPVTKIAKMKELAPGIVTLAEILKKNGYATGGFTGDAGVSGVFGYSQGFDVYEDKVKFGGMDQSIPKALAWVRENKDRKFFLFLHGYDVHGQHVPADGFDYRFVDPSYDRKFKGTREEQEALREEGLAKGRLALADEDIRFWRAIYDEKINRLDAEFGRFLAEFERLGLMKKTVFILTSDHGTEFFEHGRIDHGFSLYQELIHVPLVIVLPNLAHGKTVRDQVSSIDVMPTALELLGVPVAPEVRKQMRGESLVPAFRGASAAEDVYSETDYRLYTYKRSLITKDGWKFIITLENNSRELYNLNADPGELNNLADKEPKIAYELEQKVFSKFKSIGQDLSARQWVPGLNPVYDSQAVGAKTK